MEQAPSDKYQFYRRHVLCMIFTRPCHSNGVEGQKAPAQADHTTNPGTQRQTKQDSPG